jgi:hypothetical protein
MEGKRSAAASGHAVDAVSTDDHARPLEPADPFVERRRRDTPRDRNRIRVPEEQGEQRGLGHAPS